MSDNGEGDARVLEVAPVEVPTAAEETKVAEKVVKERKPRTPKEKKPKQLKTASHPPYFQVFQKSNSYLIVYMNMKGCSISP